MHRRVFLKKPYPRMCWAGNLMARRASYMYGNLIDAGPKGKVDGGLGKTTSTGAPGIIEPENRYVIARKSSCLG